MSIESISASPISASAVTASAVTASAVNDSGGGGYSTYYDALAGRFQHVYYLDDLTASSTAVDSVGGKNGTYTGSWTKEVAALSGGEGTCVSTTAGHIALGDWSTYGMGNAGTIEFTFTATASLLQHLFDIAKNTVNDRYFLVANNNVGNLSVLVSNGAPFRRYDVPAYTSGTHIVSVSHDGTQLKAFVVDGVDLTSSVTITESGSDATYWWGTPSGLNKVDIGQLNRLTPVGDINGSIDNVAISSTAYSADTLINNHTLAGF